MKVALVTGSGKRRVGSVIADALGERGYALAIHYRSSQSEAEEALERYRAAGVEAAAFQAELTDEGAVERMVGEVLKRLGRIDVLVHAAAIWKPKPLEQVVACDVLEHLQVNTLAPFLITQRVGLRMVGQESGGSIVLIGDWATERPYRGYAAYFPSKGAIPTMVRMFAVELGTRNPQVRVNAVLPGPVMLPPDLPEQERREAISATLVQREGRPENVAQAVAYLIENDFVTGDCIRVDGGRTIFAGGR